MLNKNNDVIIIIKIKDNKFKEIDNRYKYVLDSEYLVKEFINDLNKNKITIFMRYGYLSFFIFVFVIFFIFIIVTTRKVSLLFIFPLFFVLGIILVGLWIWKLVSWQKKCNEIRDKHVNRLKNYYNLTEITPFSYHKKNRSRRACRRRRAGGKNWKNIKYELTPVKFPLAKLNQIMALKKKVNQQYNKNINMNQRYNPNGSQQYNPEINQQFNPNINPNFNPNINPNFNQNIISNFNQNMNQQFNPNINPHLNQNMNQQFNSYMNQQYKPNNNQQFNQNMNPQFKPNINAKLDINANKQINLKNNKVIPISTFKYNNQDIKPLPDNENDLKNKNFK